jgi:phosphoribosyl-ATP pyrophosphohydrolase/phosphoribosyl-AMP cyclohydrolase/histidinol dehydrogenase
MSFPVLPVVTSPAEKATIEQFSLVGQVIFPIENVTASKHFIHQFPHDLDIFVDATDKATLDQIVELLNVGVLKIFVSLAQFTEVVAAGLPSSRFAVYVGDETPDAGLVESLASFVVEKPFAKEELKKLNNHENRTIYIRAKLTQSEANELALDYTPVLPVEELTTKREEANKISISSLFVSTLNTDRPDGLYTTLITTPSPSYTALGIVYSSKDSVIAAIEEKVGVYQSRKRRDELWYKGKTSGATQKLVKLSRDCDSDVIQFVVEPRSGYGFCHREESFTCFGDKLADAPARGLPKLDSTLQDRFKNAPEGSYTKRLFDDEKLLIAKLKEELDELIEADSKEEVAWECADLFYFAMVWCIKNGVSLADVEKNLDVKSLKVSRRKGDAKPKYQEKKEEKPEPVNPDYKLEVIEVGDAAGVERAMTRPVQKTADIMKLVLPIIEKVKSEGDKALIELTAKFDGVQLDAPVLKAPFPADLMNISEEMKQAIDLSISNIEKFHAAQLPKEEVMTVETVPGVRCSRFAKPIENVGLYVPGGTAVLPSTAMMLGVPAKVAGCKNIIIASPPSRSTGKLTPEVVYVAHKLGAKCIVMAGGAQAVTAMAYGTESVIKCDKILGPGNQFVTAAKMYVQNDTQALCSIDMPAGPSEVLVIADSHADADFVASDLLSQAEHGVDSQVILIGVKLNKEKLAEFEAAVKKHPFLHLVIRLLRASFRIVQQVRP